MFVFISCWFLGMSVEVPEVNISTEKTSVGNDHPCFFKIYILKEQKRIRDRSEQFLGQILDPKAEEDMHLKMEGRAILPKSFDVSHPMHSRTLCCVTWTSRSDMLGPQFLCTYILFPLFPEGQSVPEN